MISYPPAGAGVHARRQSVGKPRGKEVNADEGRSSRGRPEDQYSPAGPSAGSYRSGRRWPGRRGLSESMLLIRSVAYQKHYRTDHGKSKRKIRFSANYF